MNTRERACSPAGARPRRRVTTVGAAGAILASGLLLLVLRGSGRPGEPQTPIPNSRAESPVRYSVTGLGNPEGQVTSVFPRDINERGQVTGQVTLATGGTRAFLWADGKFTILWAPDGGNSTGLAVNDHSEVVGYTYKTYPNWDEHVVIFRDGKVIDTGISGRGSGINDKSQVAGVANNPRHAFLYDRGKTIDLGTLGGDYSSAAGINNRGQIAGTSKLTSGLYRAFLYRGGKMMDLGTLHGGESSASAINSKGWVIGTTFRKNVWGCAFLYRNGQMQQLEQGWGDYPFPHAINAAGTVVGQEWSELGLLGAIVWLDGHAYNLQDLIPANSGWTLRSADGINDSGQIVAYGTYGREKGYRSCILTPVTGSRTASTRSGPML